MQGYDTNTRMCRTCEIEQCQIGRCRAALTQDGTIPHILHHLSDALDFFCVFYIVYKLYIRKFLMLNTYVEAELRSEIVEGQLTEEYEKFKEKFTGKYKSEYVKHLIANLDKKYSADTKFKKFITNRIDFKNGKGRRFK